MRARDGHHTVYLCESWGYDKKWMWYYTSYHDAVIHGVKNAPWNNMRATRVIVSVPPKLGVTTREIARVLNDGLEEEFGGVAFELEGTAHADLRTIIKAQDRGLLPLSQVSDYPFDYYVQGGGLWVSNPYFGPWKVWHAGPHENGAGNPDLINIRVMDKDGVLLHGRVNAVTNKVYLKEVVDWWSMVNKYVVEFNLKNKENEQ